MNNSSTGYPFANSNITILIRNKIDEMAANKTQREIASEIGYDKPNVLSMYKRGEAKIPLRQLPHFARVLNIDFVVLLRASFEQRWPGEEYVIKQMIMDRLVTADERALLSLVQKCLHAEDAKASLELFERLRINFTK